jgi:hypothetical protein
VQHAWPQSFLSRLIEYCLNLADKKPNPDFPLIAETHRLAVAAIKCKIEVSRKYKKKTARKQIVASQKLKGKNYRRTTATFPTALAPPDSTNATKR